MNRSKDSHLDRDQLIWVVVDEARLPDSLRNHLTGCELCRGRKERLEQELGSLGRLASETAPESKPKLSLPSNQPFLYRFRWQWTPALKGAVVAGIVILVVWTGLFRSEPEQDGSALTIWPVDEVMAEINVMTESALPDVYREISLESYSNLDREFYQFVVPVGGREELSDRRLMKGVC